MRYLPVIMLLFAATAEADGLIVKEYRGDEILFPSGLSSFADQVVSVSPGKPRPSTLTDPEMALGAPDWDQADNANSTNFPNRAYALGCGGALSLRFTDNALVDVPGPDLYVFEVGNNVETTQLELSNDLKNWWTVGTIGGALAEIDLADFGLTDQNFRYVRLTDQRSDCRMPTPGADIDAVGAIGSVERLSLSTVALFDVGSSTVKPAGRAGVEAKLAGLSELTMRRIVIVGHTDTSGAKEDNLSLGQARAQAVANILLETDHRLAEVVEVQSRGEAEPVASNETPQGRTENRRVEIFLYN